MSSKVAVAPVKPEWRDAVTIGQLHMMVDSLYALGYGNDTPVTYLHDQDHVWLETVGDNESEPKPKPRVWELAREVPEGIVVSDNRGYLWKWENGRRYLKIKRWDSGIASSHIEDMPSFAPFTEVIE